MVKELDFETPEELLEYIVQNNNHHFSYVKWYERFITTHTWEDQASINIHWQGVVHQINSTSELLELHRRGAIRMLKEQVEVVYRPFNPVKRRKLTKREYQNLESAKNQSEERFEQFMESMKNEQMFEQYLKEREKKKEEN